MVRAMGPIDRSYALETCNHATVGHYGAPVCAGHAIRWDAIMSKASQAGRLAFEPHKNGCEKPYKP